MMEAAAEDESVEKRIEGAVEFARRFGLSKPSLGKSALPKLFMNGVACNDVNDVFMAVKNYIGVIRAAIGRKVVSDETKNMYGAILALEPEAVFRRYNADVEPSGELALEFVNLVSESRFSGERVQWMVNGDDDVGHQAVDRYSHIVYIPNGEHLVGLRQLAEALEYCSEHGNTTRVGFVFGGDGTAGGSEKWRTVEEALAGVRDMIALSSSCEEHAQLVTNGRVFDLRGEPFVADDFRYLEAVESRTDSVMDVLGAEVCDTSDKLMRVVSVLGQVVARNVGKMTMPASGR